jgi:ubiquitin C-terminal hydrolase
MASEVGFANLGNTCFLNSVLQALRKCSPLTDYFTTGVKIPVRNQSKKLRITDTYRELLAEIDTQKDGCIVPRKFLSALWETVQECDDDWFRPRQQADSAECLQYLLEGIHDSLYRHVRITVQGEPRNARETEIVKAFNSWASFFGKEYSIIVEKFYGQSQISIQCQTCKTVSTRYEPWLMLKAPIPGGDKEGSAVPTLYDCLKENFASEEIPDYSCEVCKSKQSATKQERISKLPTILILTLKRFTNHGNKIRGKISWDLESTRFTDWTAFQRCPFSESKRYSEFRTFAVIEHQGSAQGGHYHMFARGSNESWNNYDDCSVSLNVPDTRIISADSYILFLEAKPSH